MSENTPRLPARPSAEQLRNQAKDRLKALRESKPDAKLADAQFDLAREYGFGSWPKLVQHVEHVASSGRLALFEQLAADTLAGYHGDVEALRRLIAHYGVSYNTEQAQRLVRSKVDDARRATEVSAAPTLSEVQQTIAHQYGFESWATLAEGLAQPPSATSSARVGLSGAPPFYGIDPRRRSIHVMPPVTDADWDVVFDVMREHRLTGIESAVLTDSALRRLAALDFVTALRCDGSTSFSDDGLLHLGRMTQLEELDLSGWHSPITDRGLAMLGQLTSLKRFQMCWPQRVTDTGIMGLANCEQLESVNLLGTATGNGAITAMHGKALLRDFTTGRLVDDDGIPLLRDIPVFKTWRGGEPTYKLTGFEGEPNKLTLDGPFTNDGLKRLAGLDGLFSLAFFWHSKSFTSDGLASLADLPNLGFLGCEGENCDDAAMAHIARIPRLRKLMAQGTVATDAGFAALAQSSSIEHIWGRECPNLTGRGFVELAKMPALRGLAVSCANVDDASLSALPDFPSLTFIMPMDVPDAGFRHVGKCDRLEALWCMYCRETGDEATKHIADLQLKLYYAGKTRITDVSLEILSRMTSLERAEFWQTAGITDAGVAMLAALPNLKEIEISGAAHVTRAGASVFPSTVQVRYDA